jgi:hypothetical protein
MTSWNMARRLGKNGCDFGKGGGAAQRTSGISVLREIRTPRQNLSHAQNIFGMPRVWGSSP